MDKLKKVGLKILRGVKRFLTKSVVNILKFLGVEPEIKVMTKVRF